LLKAIMISGRTLAQGANCESKMSDEFFTAASVCSISEADFKSLGLLEGGNVLVASTFGQAVFSVHIDSGLPPGTTLIPMGPWANSLVGPDTGGCGTPQFKGVEVDIQPTTGPVLQIKELFRDLSRAKA
jgi:formylmethanofuran dehydrogenase subunit D